MEPFDKDAASPLSEYYRFFLLPEGAPFHEVKEVHRAFLKAWHPDRHQGESKEFKQLASRIMQHANEAIRAIEHNEATAGPMLRCETCGAPSEAGSHICAACGKPFLTSCPRCDRRWPSLFRYCGDCGARL